MLFFIQLPNYAACTATLRDGTGRCRSAAKAYRSFRQKRPAHWLPWQQDSVTPGRDGGIRRAGDFSFQSLVWCYGNT